MCLVWLGRLWEEKVVENDLFVAAAVEEERTTEEVPVVEPVQLSVMVLVVVALAG